MRHNWAIIQSILFYCNRRKFVEPWDTSQKHIFLKRKCITIGFYELQVLICMIETIKETSLVSPRNLLASQRVV